MKINKYPDGTSYVEIEEGIDDKEETITFKVNNYGDLHHLEQFIDAYSNKFFLAPTVIIPNLIDAQADRRFGDNQSSGLKIVLKRLNSMDANFKIFHPHNAEIVEAMMDDVEIIDNYRYIKTVFNVLKRDKKRYPLIYKNSVGRPDFSNIILMSADAGGFKPLMKLCDKLSWQGETFSASKSRSYVNGKSKLTQEIDRQDFGGKDILIIDDISVYGGTFKGLAKLLRERNCGKLYLAVSHMTVQNLGEDPVTNYFNKVFVTNSKFDSYFYQVALPAGNMPTDYQPKNLEIIKMF